MKINFVREMYQTIHCCCWLNSENLLFNKRNKRLLKRSTNKKLKQLETEAAACSVLLGEKTRAFDGQLMPFTQ